MIGKPLTSFLLEAGYEVVHLSRTPGTNDLVKTFEWDLKNGSIDSAAVKGVDAIVHLAGAGIADAPWTDERKKGNHRTAASRAQPFYSTPVRRKGSALRNSFLLRPLDGIL